MTNYSCVNCDSEYNEELIKDGKSKYIQGIKGDYIVCPKCGYFEFRIRITIERSN